MNTQKIVSAFLVVGLVGFLGCGRGDVEEDEIDGRGGRCVSGTEKRHVSFQGLAWGEPECSLSVANWKLAVEEFGLPRGSWDIRFRDYAWQVFRGGDYYAGETFPHGVIHLARDPRSRSRAGEEGELPLEVRVCAGALGHEVIHAVEVGTREGLGGWTHAGWGDPSDGAEVDSKFGRVKKVMLLCLQWWRDSEKR